MALFKREMLRSEVIWNLMKQLLCKVYYTTILCKIFSEKFRNQAKLYKTEKLSNLFLNIFLALPMRGAGPCPHPVLRFCLFSKILDFYLLGNSRDMSYMTFLILNIKYHFTCGEWNAYYKTYYKSYYVKGCRYQVLF